MFRKDLVKLTFVLLSASLVNFTLYGQKSELFNEDRILDLTIEASFQEVFKDRKEESSYHQANIITKFDSEEVSSKLKIKTRGHFRKMKANCRYPPLLLNFDKDSNKKASVFKGQNKLKLVTTCKDEEWVIAEYLVYKLYSIITPRSFRARLVRITYLDVDKDKIIDSQYGILIEDQDDMAGRNEAQILKRTGLKPNATVREDFLKMSVFQYMIGNTDWSIQYLQNIKLINQGENSLPSPVPYDFDHAGIVRASYARPAPELQLSSTLERRYRGYCIKDMSEFDQVFQTFRDLKGEFYSTYEDNSLLSETYRKQTLKFLDEFYETINDPGDAQKEFSYPCDKNGTGNIVIQGLRKN